MDFNKNYALSVILKAAKQYRDNLEDKNLLFIYQTKQKTVETFEATFLSYHFLHLTGVQIDKSVMSAEKFYEECINQRLKLSQFNISNDGTTYLKLSIINFLLTKNLGSANIIGMYNDSGFFLQTTNFVGGVKGGIGFSRHKGYGPYIPDTLIKGDMRQKIKQPGRVLLTYRKSISKDRYSELVYKAKKFDFENFVFPTDYSYLPFL